MKLIKKYLSIFAILSIAAFTACGGGTGGAPAGDIDDGLSSDYFIKSLSVDAPSLYNEDDPNATKLNLKYDFSWGEWSNELDVPYSIDIITITAEKNHNWASMYLGDAETGTALTSGDASGPRTLEVGLNTVNLTVIAQDGLEGLTLAVPDLRQGLLLGELLAEFGKFGVEGLLPGAEGEVFGFERCNALFFLEKHF